MADASTTLYGLIKPEVGASSDTWGSKLNADLDDADALLGAFVLTGSSSAYVLTTGLSLAAYASKQRFLVQWNHTNASTSPTLNVDTLGAKNIKKRDGSTSPSASDLVSGRWNEVLYDGTNIVVLDLLPSDFQPPDATLTALAAGATGADVLFYWSGSDTLSTTTLTSAARSILDDTTVAAICTTLGAAQLTANNTLSGTNTTTGQSRRHEAATPVEVTKDTGGGANAKVWRRYASSSNLIFDCLNDAEDSATSWLTVARSGQTPTLATFGVPVVTPFSVSSETNGTLSIASKNRVVNCSSGVTLPNSVFGEGQWQLLKAGSASRTITRGSGVAMYVNGTDSASATLSVRGLAGVYWESASACYLTGDVT